MDIRPIQLPMTPQQTSELMLTLPQWCCCTHRFGRNGSCQRFLQVLYRLAFKVFGWMMRVSAMRGIALIDRFFATDSVWIGQTFSTAQINAARFHLLYNTT